MEGATADMNTSSHAGDARTAVTTSPKRLAHHAGMPGLAEVWLWEHQLVEFGTRYTGSSGHTASVDWLTHQLSRVPGFTVRTDRLTFNRWLACDFALRVRGSLDRGPLRPGPAHLLLSLFRADAA